MKNFKILGIIALISICFACKKQFKNNPEAEPSPSISNQSASIVNRYIYLKQNKSNQNKSASSLVQADSAQYYIEVLSNALLSDVDTALLDLETSSQSLTLAQPSAGMYSFGYLVSKVLALNSSIRSILPINKRVYLIELKQDSTLLTYTVQVTFGSLATSSLGKAVNTINGMNYFASNQNYRMGYGNEYWNTHLVSVFGGRNQRVSSNGLVDCVTYSMVYGGMPTTPPPASNLWGQPMAGGAAKWLETYGNNNIFQTIGWPSQAPTGYKYVMRIMEGPSVDYKNTFTKDNPTYWFGNPNKYYQTLPAMIYAKFCTGETELTSFTTNPNNKPVYQPHVIPSNMLNYYLGKMPAIYTYSKSLIPSINANNYRFIRLDVEPIYGPFEVVGCNAPYTGSLFFNSINQMSTSFDPTYFPYTSIQLPYYHKYHFYFGTYTLVPDPNFGIETL